MNSKRVLALLLVIAVVLIAGFSKDSLVPTSYSAKPTGVRASAELLTALGYNVVRWREPIGKLDDPNALLLIVAPSAPLVTSEIRQWLSKGNRAIIFQSMANSLLLESLSETKLDTEGLSLIEEILQIDNVSTPVVCTEPALCKSVSAISKVQAPLLEEVGESRVLVRQEHGVVVIETPVEKGSLISILSPKFILNEFIDKSDNIQFLINLLPSKDTTIYYDEFHHGYLPVVPVEKKAFLYSVVVFAAVLLLLLLLHVLGRAIRFGPPSIELENDAKSSQLTTALAMLLYENKTPGSLNGYVSAWKEIFGRSYGISSRYSNEDFCNKLSKSGFRNSNIVRSNLNKLCADASVSNRQIAEAVESLEQIRREQSNG